MMSDTVYKDAPTPAGEKLYTADEVAKALRVTPKTVRRWCMSGEIDAMLLGGRWYRISQAALDAFREKHAIAKEST